jgi:arabinogalactan oligomer/maltooligosaccharide transport system permease protein
VSDRVTVGRVARVAALVLASLLTLYPILLVIKKALSAGQGFDPSLNPIPVHPTLAQLHDVLAGRDEGGSLLFLRQLGNSLAVAAGTTVLGVTLSATAAWALSRRRFPGRNAALASFLIVQMFPSTLLLVPTYVILARLGLADSLLGLVLVYTTTSVPFCVFMLKGYFDTLPRELEEAARVDGCTGLQLFVRVVLPLARPALAVTALFSFMTAWNEFILADTLLSKERLFTLPVALARYVGAYNVEWGHFAAGALLVSLPVMALFYALERHLVAGLTAGSVKG